MSRYKTILIHCFCWLLFIFYELGLLFVLNGKTTSAVDYIVHYALSIGFFYSNANLLLWGLPRKSGILLSVLIFMEVCLYIGLSFAINRSMELLHIPLAKHTFPLTLFLLSSLWRGLYFIGLSCAYALAIYNVAVQRSVILLQQEKLSFIDEQNDLEKRLLVSKNAYLKLQINPHMMFNTLNFIYNKVRKVSVDAGKAVLLLSEISRYTYSSTNQGETSLLINEVEQIENLIALNQLRFDNNLQVNLSLSGNFQGLQIPSLVLITFVENVFKYGDLFNDEQMAKIDVAVNDHSILFQTFNLKSKKKDDTLSTKLGISNTVYRLESYYKNNFLLDITDNELFFKVNLKINNDEL